MISKMQFLNLKSKLLTIKFILFALLLAAALFYSVEHFYYSASIDVSYIKPGDIKPTVETMTFRRKFSNSDLWNWLVAR